MRPPREDECSARARRSMKSRRDCGAQRAPRGVDAWRTSFGRRASQVEAPAAAAVQLRAARHVRRGATSTRRWRRRRPSQPHSPRLRRCPPSAGAVAAAARVCGGGGRCVKKSCSRPARARSAPRVVRATRSWRWRRISMLVPAASARALRDSTSGGAAAPISGSARRRVAATGVREVQKRGGRAAHPEPARGQSRRAVSQMEGSPGADWRVALSSSLASSIMPARRAPLRPGCSAGGVEGHEVAPRDLGRRSGGGARFPSSRGRSKGKFASAPRRPIDRPRSPGDPASRRRRRRRSRACRWARGVQPPQAAGQPGGDRRPGPARAPERAGRRHRRQLGGDHHVRGADDPRVGERNGAGRARATPIGGALPTAASRRDGGDGGRRERRAQAAGQGDARSPKIPPYGSKNPFTGGARAFTSMSGTTSSPAFDGKGGATPAPPRLSARRALPGRRSAPPRVSCAHHMAYLYTKLSYRATPRFLAALRAARSAHSLRVISSGIVHGNPQHVKCLSIWTSHHHGGGDAAVWWSAAAVGGGERATAAARTVHFP